MQNFVGLTATCRWKIQENSVSPQVKKAPCNRNIANQSNEDYYPDKKKIEIMSSHSQDKHPFYFPVPEDSFRPSVVEFIDFDRPLSLHWVPTSIARFGRLVLLERSSKRTSGIFEHEIFPQPHNFFSILKLNGFKIFPDIPKKFVTFPGSLEFHDIFRFSRFPGRVTTLIYQREEDRSEFESCVK